MGLQQLQCEACGAQSSVNVPDDGSATVWECPARIAAPEGAPEGTPDSACDHLNHVEGTTIPVASVIVAPGERSHEEALAAGEAGHPAGPVENVPIVTLADGDVGVSTDQHRS